jgi:hypothetical protein
MAAGQSGVTGIQLSCEGDRQILGAPTYQVVGLPRDILSSASDVPTPVIDRIGLTLIVMKQPPSLAWRDRQLGKRMHCRCE